MYSHMVMVQQPTVDQYQHFVHKGAALELTYLDQRLVLNKGQRFGLRMADNKIRLILDEDLSKVFTISMATMKQLAKRQLAVN